MKFNDLVNYNKAAQKNRARDFRIKEVVNDNKTYVLLPVDRPILEETKVMDDCHIVNNIMHSNMRITNIGLMKTWVGFN